MGPARHLLRPVCPRLFRDRAQGAGPGQDSKRVPGSEGAPHGDAGRSERGVRQGQSRPHSQCDRGRLRQPPAARGPPLPEQGAALPRLRRGRPPRLPPRAYRDAAGARRQERLRAGLIRTRRLRDACRQGASDMTGEIAKAGRLCFASSLRIVVPLWLIVCSMNYCHAFHAGNFADVVKHAVLARIVAHLRAKATAFRVIDTHAGAGCYDLTGAEASRTGEWRDGIARLLAARLAPEVKTLLAPYPDVVAAFNAGGELRVYPGSPEIARAGLRPHDRLLACELEPNAARALMRNLARDKRVKAVAIDGWTALVAYVPPKERRGVVLVDPAFEQPDEMLRLADRFAAAYGKWATGIYLLWYPMKQRHEADALARELERLAIAK